MFHFVYHTVIRTIKTGKIRHYIGKHSTENLDDGYIGSGKRIKYIKNKEKQNPGTYEFSFSRSKFFESSDEAYYFEELAISEARDKFGKENVLNISDGGVAPILRGEDNPMYGRNHSEVTRRSISEKHKGKKLTEDHKRNIGRSLQGENNYWYRKHLPDSVKSKISEAHKGKVLSEEHKYNISKSLRASEFNGPWKGKKLSIEHRTNIGKSLSGKNNGMYGKPSPRRSPIWNYYDEIKQLWLDNKELTNGKFRKLAVSLGYPDFKYDRMIFTFK
ncbi:NUMOD3 domain-containing DNA-binding protein [Klebsiella pneumoniae]|uniref:NUMOD3 domain-containing DNA-binding protein n=1 Tax=Klebsiella pneumoniae TaxID=573 RepID=UPI0038D16232